MRATLLRQEERLEAKLRSSLHAAAVAHEINLPLSTLLLNTRLLLEQAGDQAQGVERERLEAMGVEAQRVVTTIEKMRTLLRNVQTEHQPLDLTDVTRSALLQTRSAQRKAGVALTRDSSLDTPVEVQGDPTQIQIAIVNLLRNALEALGTRPSSDSVPQIAVSLERSEGVVDLIVDDNGPGFPAGQTAIAPPGNHQGRWERTGAVRGGNHHGQPWRPGVDRTIDLGRRPGAAALPDRRKKRRLSATQESVEPGLESPEGP